LGVSPRRVVRDARGRRDRRGGLGAGREDGLAKLVLRLGPEVRACVEMMSGAVWVRDRLTACGWAIEIADGARSRRSPRWPARPRA
jgi:hypothetical protein